MAIKKTSKKHTRPGVVKIKAWEDLKPGDIVTIKNRRWYKFPPAPAWSVPLSNEQVTEIWEELHLLAKQELFCQLYTSKEFFGNWVQSYIEAYDPDQSKPNWYKTACASAWQILSNIKVCTRINELLDESGLNDQFVDKQLLFLITQHDEKGSKLGAIKEYNALKQRITKKLDVTSWGNPYQFSSNLDSE